MTPKTTPTAGTTPRPWIGAAACPVCGNGSLIRLPADWQDQVEAGGAIPIVACGNPWHYSNISLRDIEAAEAALAEAEHRIEQIRMHLMEALRAKGVRAEAAKIGVRDALAIVDAAFAAHGAGEERE